MKVKFKQWDCKLKLMHYGNLRPAFLLVDAEDGSPIAKGTVNVPEEPMGPDEVIIKDYAENEGMSAALIDAGIIEPAPKRVIPVGRTTCPIYQMTEKMSEAFTILLASESEDDS
jgi:hypothetical protein